MNDIIEVSEAYDSIDKLVAAFRDKGFQREVERAIELAGCEPCEAFGGRRTQMTAAPIALGQGSAIPGIDGGMSLVAQLGIGVCREWGAKAPEGSRQANGCYDGRKVCLGIGPYFASVAQSSTDTYELKAKVWYRPMFFNDNSDSEISIVDMVYMGTSLWETEQVAGMEINPAAQWAADSNTVFVPGLPAIDSVNGLKFSLLNSDSSNPKVFRGYTLGPSARL